MSKTGEQTVRVLDEAYKTIRSGAPGLSDQTCNVLAGIIARKVSIVYAQPHPSQQAGTEALNTALQEAADAVEFFDRVKSASLDERIAVGPDHWNRMEAALRSLAALTSEAKG